MTTYYLLTINKWSVVQEYTLCERKMSNKHQHLQKFNKEPLRNKNLFAFDSKPKRTAVKFENGENLEEENDFQISKDKNSKGKLKYSSGTKIVRLKKYKKQRSILIGMRHT